MKGGLRCLKKRGFSFTTLSSAYPLMRTRRMNLQSPPSSHSSHSPDASRLLFPRGPNQTDIRFVHTPDKYEHVGMKLANKSTGTRAKSELTSMSLNTPKDKLNIRRVREEFV